MEFKVLASGLYSYKKDDGAISGRLEGPISLMNEKIAEYRTAWSYHPYGHSGSHSEQEVYLYFPVSLSSFSRYFKKNKGASYESLLDCGLKKTKKHIHKEILKRSQEE